MTGEECVKLFHNLELRDYICRIATGRSKSQEELEDYVQECWLRIWKDGHGDKDIEYYKKLARKAVHAAYMREWRYKRHIRSHF